MAVLVAIARRSVEPLLRLAVIAALTGGDRGDHLAAVPAARRPLADE